MYQNEIKSMKQKFEQVMEKLKEDFMQIRTGRATTGLVENVMVTYYGSTVALKQMATLTIPDPSSILIQPWDANALGDIELAIQNVNLGLNASSDGHSLRVILPAMTEERREELIRNISRKGEEARIAFRNIRGEVWDRVKKMEKSGDLTEDDRYSAEEELNKYIDEYNKKVEQLIEEKEKDLRAV